MVSGPIADIGALALLTQSGHSSRHGRSLHDLQTLRGRAPSQATSPTYGDDSPVCVRNLRTPRRGHAQGSTAAFRILPEGQAFSREIFQLSPQNEAQRSLRDLAIKLTADLGQTRLLLFATIGSSIPLPFLTILISWVTILFVSFGVLMRVNPLAISAILLCAISTTTALYLILELGTPFSGVMAIASEPIRNALIPLTQ